MRLQAPRRLILSAPRTVLGTSHNNCFFKGGSIRLPRNQSHCEEAISTKEQSVSWGRLEKQLFQRAIRAVFSGPQKQTENSCWEEGVRQGHPGGDPQPRSLEDKWQDLTSKKRAHRSTENRAKPTEGRAGYLDHWSRLLEVRPGRWCWGVRAVAIYQPDCQYFRFLRPK